MTSAIERMRARLEKSRLEKAKKESGVKDNEERVGGIQKHGHDNSSNHYNSSGVSGIDGDSRDSREPTRDFETTRTDLRLCCAIYLRGRKWCYPNYMDRGFKVFNSLLPLYCIENFLSKYCKEVYPRICMCGAEQHGNGILSAHCPECEGKNHSLRYEIQRLENETGIHYSWLEYGFAYALVGSGNRSENSESDR